MSDLQLFSTLTFPEIYERVLVGPLFRPFAQEVIARLEPTRSDSLIDIACGTGIVARLARETLGPGSRIVGVDIAPAMLAVARSIDPSIDWREGTVMSLPVTDQDHWGVADRWDYPDNGMGDCEDIQLLKRRVLIEAGLPRRALRMTVVIDELGAGHAVLMVRTDRGDYILDNKRAAVLSWQETGYRYVKREGSESAAWVWLGNQAAPIMTATK